MVGYFKPDKTKIISTIILTAIPYIISFLPRGSLSKLNFLSPFIIILYGVPIILYVKYIQWNLVSFCVNIFGRSCNKGVLGDVGGFILVLFTLIAYNYLMSNLIIEGVRRYKSIKTKYTSKKQPK